MSTESATELLDFSVALPELTLFPITPEATRYALASGYHLPRLQRSQHVPDQHFSMFPTTFMT